MCVRAWDKLNTKHLWIRNIKLKFLVAYISTLKTGPVGRLKLLWLWVVMTLNSSMFSEGTDKFWSLTRRWHVTISCQSDGRPPQPVRPWKSGRVHLAEGSNVVVLDLPYSTEFGRDSRKFASGVRKYGKFSHFLTHLVVYGGQGKNKYYLL